MIAGNLCRCTGYQNIVDAVLRAAELTADPAAPSRDGDAREGRSATRYFGTVRAPRTPAGHRARPLHRRHRVRHDAPTPRSSARPHAHAEILDIDVDRCAGRAGVMAIYTHEDLEGAAAEPLPVLIPHPALRAPRTGYPLARTTVHHVGEAIVMVVAQSRYLAEDAAPDRVSYRVLPPVVGIAAARAAEQACTRMSRTTWPRTWSQQNGDFAPASAAVHVLELDLPIERSCSMPLEGKAVHARWDADDGSLRVYSSTQASTSVRAAIAAKLGLPLPKVEVIAPDVGGGFGVKIVHPWPEEIAGADGGDPAAASRSSGPRTAASTSSPRRTSAARSTTSGSGSTTAGAMLAPGRHLLARQRRLHAVRHHLPDRHLDAAARAVQARRLPGASSLALHEHGHRHALPRRGPAAGRVRHGAHDGRASPTTSGWTARGPRPQLHPARGVPLRPGPDLPGRPAADLRLRRLPGPAGEDQGADRLGRLPGASGRRRPPMAGCSASGSACYVEGTGPGPYEGAHVQVLTDGSVRSPSD